jgi:hypothetical protein
MRHHPSAALLALVAACGDGGSPPDVTPAHSTARAASSIGVEPAVPQHDIGLHVAAVSTRHLRFHPIEGALFVSAGGYLAEVTGARLEERPVPAVHEIGRVLGRWPDRAWVSGWRSGGTRRGVSAGARWYADAGWKAVDDAEDATLWNAVAFPGGRLLLQGEGISWREGKTVLPSVAKIERGECKIELGKMLDGVVAEGHLWVLAEGRSSVHRCSTGEQQSRVVAHWGPGATEGQLHALPGSNDGVVFAEHIAAASPREVWVAGPRSDAAYLARFDGSSWARIEMPPTRLFPISISVDSRGAAWIVASGDAYGRGERDGIDVSTERGEVWTREPGGEWRAIALPRHPDVSANGDLFFPLAVLARAPGDVWISGMWNGTSRTPWGLLHTGPVTPTITVEASAWAERP